jgi:hypothetical protein
MLERADDDTGTLKKARFLVGKHARLPLEARPIWLFPIPCHDR